MRRTPTRAVAAALLAAMLALATPAVALAAVSLPEYATRLEEAHAAVAARVGDAGDPQVAVALVAEVGELLPADETVTVGDASYPLRDPVVADALTTLQTATAAAAREDAADALLVRLTSLRVVAGESAEGVTAHDPAVLARIIEEERIGDRATPEWVQELERIVREWLDSIFSRLDVTVPDPVFEWILPIASAIILLVVALLVWRLWRRGVRRRDMVETLADKDGALPVVAVAEGLPDDVLAYADAAAADGRHRDAVRALFGGAARSLGEKGVLPRTKTRTTAELLADVTRSRAPLTPALTELAGVFEPAWYGHHEPGAPGFDSAREAYVRFSAMLEGGEAS